MTLLKRILSYKIIANLAKGGIKNQHLAAVLKYNHENRVGLGIIPGIPGLAGPGAGFSNSKNRRNGIFFHFLKSDFLRITRRDFLKHLRSVSFESV